MNTNQILARFPLNLDKPRECRLTVAVIVETEKKIGKAISQMDCYNDFAALVTAGCVDEDPSVTVEMIQPHIRAETILTAAAAMSAARKAGFRPKGYFRSRFANYLRN